MVEYGRGIRILRQPDPLGGQRRVRQATPHPDPVQQPPCHGVPVMLGPVRPRHLATHSRWPQRRAPRYPALGGRPPAAVHHAYRPEFWSCARNPANRHLPCGQSPTPTVRARAASSMQLHPRPRRSRCRPTTVQRVLRLRESRSLCMARSRALASVHHPPPQVAQSRTKAPWLRSEGDEAVLRQSC